MTQNSDVLGRGADALAQKWAPVLEGIGNDYTRKVTAILLENQAKQAVNEDLSAGATTTGKLGTFQKFAFPLVRRVFPELFFNKIGSVQPMEGPVSQIFYLGSSRQMGATEQVLYSKYNLTYRNMVTSAVGGSGLDLDNGAGTGLFLSSMYGRQKGSPSTTFGGQIAMWPSTTTTLGYNVSAGERMSGSGIPEMNFHIEQQPVVARTRKMRALWTIEANQDLKAYHNLDLERELTDLMGKELELEIDRELIEDIRGLAYDANVGNGLGGWYRDSLDGANSNNFGTTGGHDGFTPAAFTYDFTNAPSNPSGTLSNVYIIDFTSSALPFAPQHVGHVWANLLAVINLASNDIYKTTFRGPGKWLLTSPLMAALLESAAKLEGGMQSGDGPSNITANSVEFKGKLAGKYDLYVDPMYPEDEILIGYKGASPLDAGFCYCPYIPIESLPTITDPETFQPRKGILTRYGKAAIAPSSRFYRIVRVVGPSANYLFTPFGKSYQNNAAN